MKASLIDPDEERRIMTEIGRQRVLSNERLADILGVEVYIVKYVRKRYKLSRRPDLI